VADANTIMDGIANVQKIIADKYQPKQPTAPAKEVKANH
jgi:hypothetical protein